VDDFSTLITRALKGDKAAQAELARECLSIDGALINKYPGLSKDLIKDILQQTWLKVHGSLPTFKKKSRSGFRAWVITIAVNLLTDYFRSRGRHGEVFILFSDPEDDKAVAFDPPDTNLQTSPEATLRMKEAWAHLQKCIEELPVQFHQIFWRRVFDEMSDDDVAAIMNIKRATVATGFHRARSRIHDCLEELGLIEEEQKKTAP